MKCRAPLCSRPPWDLGGPILGTDIASRVSNSRHPSPRPPTWADPSPGPFSPPARFHRSSHIQPCASPLGCALRFKQRSARLAFVGLLLSSIRLRVRPRPAVGTVGFLLAPFGFLASKAFAARIRPEARFHPFRPPEGLVGERNTKLQLRITVLSLNSISSLALPVAFHQPLPRYYEEIRLLRGRSSTSFVASFGSTASMADPLRPPWVIELNVPPPSTRPPINAPARYDFGDVAFRRHA